MCRLSRRCLGFAFALFCALAVVPLAAGSEPPDEKNSDAKPAEALPAKLSGFSDAGAFDLYKSEERLAHIDFTWKDDGTFENKSVLEFGGQKLDMHFRITPDKDGRWTKIDGTGRGGKFTVEREGGKVKRTVGDWFGVRICETVSPSARG